MRLHCLKYTADAQLDLAEIAHFIAQDNPQRALSFVDEIKQRCERIAANPQSRPVVQEIAADVHRSVFGNCNIYYVIGENVVVFAVLEGHRNQARALQNRPFK